MIDGIQAMSKSKWCILLCVLFLVGCSTDRIENTAPPAEPTPDIQITASPARNLETPSPAQTLTTATPLLGASPVPGPSAAQSPSAEPSPSIEPSPSSEPVPIIEPSDISKYDNLNILVQVYENVKRENDEVAGWLAIANTTLNHYFMLGEDNEFYLRHDVQKNKSRRGAIFMDYRNAEPDNQLHLIIYGKNVINGGGWAFDPLEKYEDKKFFMTHKELLLYWQGEVTRWELFAAQHYDVRKQNLTAVAFGSVENFRQYMAGIKELSDFQNDVAVEEADQMLTLLTGSKLGGNFRYVVHFMRKEE